MNDGEARLVLLARLRAELLALHGQGRVSDADLATKAAQLDRLTAETVAGLGPLPLGELLERCERERLGLDLSSLRSQARSATLVRIRQLRNAALERGFAVLELEEVHPGIHRVPLREHSWQETSTELAELFAVLKDPAEPWPRVRQASRRFFKSRDDAPGFIPAQLPGVSGALIQRLIRNGVIAPTATSAFVRDLDALNAAFRAAASTFSHRALHNGHIEWELYDPPSDVAFRVLERIASSFVDRARLDPDAFIVQWPGPAFAALALRWFPRKQGETQRHQQRKAELIYARTGLDPLSPRGDQGGETLSPRGDQGGETLAAETEWQGGMRARIAAERLEMRRVREQVGLDRDFYDLAVVIAAEPVLEERVESAWWPLLEAVRGPAPVEPPAPAPASAPVEPPAPANEPAALFEALVPEDDMEHLKAPLPARSPEDRLVEEKSTWSVYLKPFLNENGLGLVGVLSLMAAWMFFALWLWDAGKTFRILGGVVPLAILGGSAAFISRFIEQLENASRSAVRLFAVLACLSIPFNYALGASILDQGTGSSIPIALVLLLAYSASLPWIGGRVAPAFGAPPRGSPEHNPWRFLFESNVLIFLPPAVILLLGAQRLGPALSATLFLSYLALVRGLARARRDTADPWFAAGLLVTSFVLANAIPHIYYLIPPTIVELAVLLQLMAPAITFFGDHRPATLLTAAGCSVLGLMLAFDQPRLLPFVLVLAIGFWLVERRHTEATWPDEVLALHFPALAAAVAYFVDLETELWPAALVPAFVAIVVLEYGRRQTEVLTWWLPIYMAGAVLLHTLRPAPLPLILGLLGLTFAYSYFRYVRGYRVPFWFLNLGLFAVLLGIALGLELVIGSLPLILYTSTVALSWALFSTHLADPITTSHRTLVTWCLSFVAAGVLVMALMTQDRPFELLLAAALGATFISLVLAATRSHSPVPVYVALALVALMVQWVRAFLGIASRTGLATASTAFALLGLAALFERFHVGADDEADRLLGRPFPGRGERFLVQPCEVSTLLLAGLATFKAGLVFAPFAEQWKPATALTIATLALMLLARRWGEAYLGYLGLVPFFGAIVALILSLPIAWRCHAIFVVLALLHLAGKRMDLWDGAHRRAVTVPVRQLTTIASLLSIPFGLLAYLLVMPHGLAVTLGLAVVAIVFSHAFLVRHWQGWVQVVLLHVAAAWLAVVLLLADPGSARESWLGWAQIFCAGVFLCLALPNLWETTRSTVWGAYCRSVQFWLAPLAVGMTALGWLAAVTTVFSPPDLLKGTARDSAVLVLAVAWLMLQVANRHWQHPLLVLLKGLACLPIGYLVTEDFLAGAFAGLVLFLGLEMAIRRLEPVLGPRLVATPKALAGDPRRDMAWTLLVLAVVVLSVHYGMFVVARAAGATMLGHFWLYGLIPIFFLLYRMLVWRWLRYAGLALFAYANSFYAWELLPLVRVYDLTPLHLVSFAFVVSIGFYRLAGHFWPERFPPPELEKLSLLLAVAATALLGLNFTLSHHLEEGSRIRFVVSGVLLGLTALHLRGTQRGGTPSFTEIGRAAYRVSTTLMFWSLGYALFPYPRTFLYLVIFPALFFLFRAEVKARAGRSVQEDVVASGLLLAIGAFLYFEQQPLQVILFDNASFNWLDYYYSAPVLLLIGFALTRLARYGWPALALLGTALATLAAVLIASLLTPVPRVLGVPVELIYVVAFLHLALVLVFVRWMEGVTALFHAFAGLAGEEQRRFQQGVFWFGNVVLQAAIPFVLFPEVLPGAAFEGAAGGNPRLLVLVIAAIAGLVYHAAALAKTVAFVEAAVLIFPVSAFLYPELPATALAVLLGALLVFGVLLRRSLRFSAMMPNAAYLICAFCFVGSLFYRGLMSPSSLLFLGVLAATWLALPDRPGRLPISSWHLPWPFVAALVLLCLGRGYEPSLWPVWALLVMAPPFLLYLVLDRVDVVRRYGWIGVASWLPAAPRALTFLSWTALLIAAIGFVLDYERYVLTWGGLLLILAVLGLNTGFYLLTAVRTAGPRAATMVEIHLWLILGLVRFKLAAVDALALGTAADGYAFLSAAFIVAGLREVLHRRTAIFSAMLMRSLLIYSFLGWFYMLWLEIFYTGGFHGEIGSMMMAALYYYFSLTRRRTFIVPAIVFVNVATVLFFVRSGLFHPQFYVLPTVASVLLLAHLLKEDLTLEQQRAVRLVCSLVLLGTTSFYNIVDFSDSLGYPLIAAIVAVLGVVVGISLRVRIYLYLGLSFFLVNTLAVLVHVIRLQPPGQVKLLIGVVFLVIGILFTGSFLLLQMKRQEILNQYASLKAELGTWE